MFRQPMAGIIAATIVMAISLGFISLFTYDTFTGWIGYWMMSIIPTEVMIGVIWSSSQPAFVARASQPMRGLYLVGMTVLGGLIFGSIMYALLGAGMATPNPILVHCTITVVVVTFWMCIMMGGWPFTRMISNPVAAGIAMLIGIYVINFLLFQLFFDYSFLSDAPVYAAGSDPQGLFNGWSATVFYVTFVAMMFFVLHFDLWPLTRFPGIMKQPLQGIAFTLLVLFLTIIVWWLAVILVGMDVVQFMVALPIPFIFGTIIILNMMQNSFFTQLTQPLQGLCKMLFATVLGLLLAWLYGQLAEGVTGPMSPGAPAYLYEIWLATALLGITFPLLIIMADYFGFAGLLKTDQTTGQEAELKAAEEQQ